MGAKRPRFIAGAVCPRCGAVDRIVVVEHESGRQRACIVCDFSDEVPATGSAPPLPLLEGRLDARHPSRNESAGETRAVRIVDGDPKK